MNPRRRCVELRTSAHTVEAEVLQKGADFLKAFMLGFDVPDALALLRLDDLFVESFDVRAALLSAHVRPFLPPQPRSTGDLPFLPLRCRGWAACARSPATRAATVPFPQPAALALLVRSRSSSPSPQNAGPPKLSPISPFLSL